MPKIVALPQDISAPGKDFLKDKGYEVRVGDGSAAVADVIKNIAGADAVLARTAPFSAEVLSAAPTVKIVARFGVGYDNVDTAYCAEHGIWVTITVNSNAVTVAEHTLGFLVGAAHNFSLFDRGTRQGRWDLRNRKKFFDVAGKTLGLIGLGRIGSMVAKKAMAAFDMSVIGYDPFLPADRFPAGVAKAEAAEVFAKADFVSLHLPCTADTKGMVNAATLSTMKKSAYLINCSRGGLVNEADLCAALSEERIAGAALDVFEPEPPKADNPLLALDNVLLTPHSAGTTQEAMDRMGIEAAQAIHDVLTGSAPKSPVNRPVFK